MERDDLSRLWTTSEKIGHFLDDRGIRHLPQNSCEPLLELLSVPPLLANFVRDLNRQLHFRSLSELPWTAKPQTKLNGMPKLGFRPKTPFASRRRRHRA